MENRIRRGWRRYFWQRLRNPAKKTKLAFIVGCGRSGTSMLLHHLSRSWAVDPFNENHEAAFDKFRLRPLNVIEELVERSYAQLAIFKPVLTTPHSREYLNQFPDARLIFVYRHFDDVVNSSLKRFGPADRLAHVFSWMADDFSEFAPIAPPEQSKAVVRDLWKPDLSPESAAALYWLFYNNLYFHLNLDREERVMLIDYEFLVTNADSEMRRACSHFGLRFEPTMTEGIFATSVGRDTSPAVLGNIREACEELLVRLRTARTQSSRT